MTKLVFFNHNHNRQHYLETFGITWEFVERSIPIEDHPDDVWEQELKDGKEASQTSGTY